MSNSNIIPAQFVGKAIDAYIKDNFRAHRCSMCRTSTEVGFDELSGDTFCTPCLRKSLNDDHQSLVDYVEGYNGDD